MMTNFKRLCGLPVLFAAVAVLSFPAGARAADVSEAEITAYEEAEGPVLDSDDMRLITDEPGDIILESLDHEYEGNTFEIRYETGKDTCEIRACRQGDGVKELKIPSTVTIGEKTYTVTSIGDRAFSGKTFVGALIIPDTVTHIGANAFSRCEGFTGALIIPDSVTIIDSYAFARCTGFGGKLVIGKNVTSIGGHAFYKDAGLVGPLTLGDSLTVIGASAFSECTALTGNLMLPETVATIGDHAFNNCAFNGTLYLDGALASLGRNAFKGTTFSKIHNASSVELDTEWFDVDEYNYYTNDANGAKAGKKLGKGEYTRYSDPIAAFVRRLYLDVLSREYDDRGFKDWYDKLKNGEQTGAEVAYGFYFSEEVKNKGLDDRGFTELLYIGLLGRASDEDGMNYWLTRTENGASWKYLFSNFVMSDEFGQKCSDAGIKHGNYKCTEPRDMDYRITAFVARLYNNILGRKFDVDGLNYWCKTILDTPTHDKLIEVSTHGFFDSNEMKSRELTDREYVEILYRTFLGRASDEDGMNYWLDKIKGGSTRREVLLGFANSKEFAEMMPF